jgi:hypothetical protein
VAAGKHHRHAHRTTPGSGHAACHQDLGDPGAAGGAADDPGGTVPVQLPAVWASRIEELLTADDAAAESLTRFADEHGVRMMSIHKSKGLEFKAVAVIAVEHEMFWSDNDAERAVFFVGISRAKRQLLLTQPALGGGRLDPGDRSLTEPIPGVS